MGDKYKNEKDVYIETHTDKNGKDHVNFYDKNPKEPDHKSIHINWDSETGKGTIVDTTSGSKEPTDVKCFLTTACMRHFLKEFDDNCYELTVLRWFRDNFVSREDIKHYYVIAPSIVDAINNNKDTNQIYDYIYDNVVDYCVKQIELGNYDVAYDRYKNSMLALENVFLKQAVTRKLSK